MTPFIQRLAQAGGDAIDRIQHLPEQTKLVGDAVSIGTVLGAITGALPAIAAVLTIIWTAIRIWETKTVQGWRNKEPPA